ncbi:MAG: phycocyanobilin:ferredoxin oxidoreductase [Symploca sp. SIO2G7]|nr:phycocyanobilin:ferredoxin oxidoreductase [Symploca sp. SIO2G7]
MLTISTGSLREQQHPLVHKLADCIESNWQRYLELSPYQLPAELGYVEGRLEDEKITIENRCYQTPQFRKMHLELAKIGKKLDILHCVMFPRPEYALPIFGCDIVAGKENISAAIADLSPVNSEHILPSAYRHQLQALPTPQFKEHRSLPDWADIFSEFCLFVRPNGPEEENQFFSWGDNLLQIHCTHAADALPASPEQQVEIIAGQHYYCTKQQQNDKTRRVLEKAFGVEWAERYMTSVLFDLPT